MATLTKPNIVKRELTSQGFIKLTDTDGIIYRSVSGKVIGSGYFVDDKTGLHFTTYTNELKNKKMINANRNVQEFSRTYSNGIADEKRIVKFLEAQGFPVRPATKEENRYQDIDCWLGDTPVSIKAEHGGLKWNNIYFELRNQLTATGEWVADGWYNKGLATKYLILQGQELRLYDKQAIKDYVESNGWLKVRTLSWSVKAQQGGSYRTMDTESGFLCRDSVPFEQSWKLV